MVCISKMQKIGTEPSSMGSINISSCLSPAEHQALDVLHATKEEDSVMRSNARDLFIPWASSLASSFNKRISWSSRKLKEHHFQNGYHWQPNWRWARPSLFSFIAFYSSFCTHLREKAGDFFFMGSCWHQWVVPVSPHTFCRPKD